MGPPAISPRRGVNPRGQGTSRMYSPGSYLAFYWDLQGNTGNFPFCHMSFEFLFSIAMKP